MYFPLYDNDDYRPSERVANNKRYIGTEEYIEVNKEIKKAVTKMILEQPIKYIETKNKRKRGQK